MINSNELDDMTREQLINLVKQTALERDLIKEAIDINKVGVDSIRVESSEPLEVCEQLINRLIDRNKDFLLEKRKKDRVERMGGYMD